MWKNLWKYASDLSQSSGSLRKSSGVLWKSSGVLIIFVYLIFFRRASAIFEISRMTAGGLRSSLLICTRITALHSYYTFYTRVTRNSISFLANRNFVFFFFKCFRPLARAYVFQTKDFSRQCEAKVLLLVFLGSGIQVLPCRRHTCNWSIVSDLILGIVSLIIYNEVCGSLGNARRVLYILYGKEPLTLNSSSFRGRIQSYRKPDSCVSYSLLTLNQEPFSKKPHFSQPYL